MNYQTENFLNQNFSENHCTFFPHSCHPDHYELNLFLNPELVKNENFDYVINKNCLGGLIFAADIWDIRNMFQVSTSWWAVVLLISIIMVSISYLKLRCENLYSDLYFIFTIIL